MVIFISCYGIFVAGNTIAPLFYDRDKIRCFLFTVFKFRMEAVTPITSEWMITLLGISFGGIIIGIYSIISTGQPFFVAIANIFALVLFFKQITSILVEFSIMSDESAIQFMEPSNFQRYDDIHIPFLAQ